MKTLEDFRLAGHALTETCLVPVESRLVTREAAKRKHRALWMARRCRRMVVLAFLTHASFELCGFVGSWRAKDEGAPMRPMTLGVKAVDPAAAAALGAASAATSLVDFFRLLQKANQVFQINVSRSLTVAPGWRSK